jgi:hypothetical protein
MTKLVHLTELEVNAGCRTWVAHSEKKIPVRTEVKQIKFHFPSCGRITNQIVPQNTPLF